MKAASETEAKAVLDAVANGDAIPAGFAFDGTAAWALEPADVAKIEAGEPLAGAGQPPPQAPAPDAGAAGTKA